MMLSSQAIGIFDSGVGGLTVMRQLMNALPHERLIYFGDTARLPYGNKSPQTIINYSIENTILLLKHNIKLLVVACNTASAFALPKLRQLFKLPIIGVIDAGAKKAVALTSGRRIAVLGTKGTIESGAYQAAIQKLAPNAFVLPIACPLFVPLVEEHWLDHPATRLIIKEYLRPIREENIDTVLLGCTHYPLLASLIQEEIGEEVIIADPASTCAEQVFDLLEQKQLLSPILQGQHQYYASDDPKKFYSLAQSLFNEQSLKVDLLR
ncbi:MAG: glutamate racemase [Parachlamydiaceae bacterium]